MRPKLLLAILFISCGHAEHATRGATGVHGVYYPGPSDAWERRPPEVLGMDSLLLQDAIELAQSHETSMPRDPGQYLRNRFAGLEHQELVGPKSGAASTASWFDTDTSLRNGAKHVVRT